MAENQELNVRVYYQSLSKKERGQLLKYLFLRYDYNMRTFSYKLTHEDALLRRSEKENIQDCINSGVWRQ